MKFKSLKLGILVAAAIFNAACTNSAKPESVQKTDAKMKLAECLVKTEKLDIFSLAATPFVPANDPRMLGSAWKVVDLPASLEGGKVLEGSGLIPLEVKAPGKYRVILKYHTGKNQYANLLVRIDAPNGECVRYERVDASLHLPSAKPYAFTKTPERDAGSHFCVLDQNFEYAGTYAMLIEEVRSAHSQGKNPKRIEAVYLTNDMTFDPEKSAVIKPAYTENAALPAPNMVPARVNRISTDLNSGITDFNKRYRSTLIHCHPIFANPVGIIDYGANFEQTIRVGAPYAEYYKLPGSGSVEKGPGSKALEEKYPMPKVDKKNPDAKLPEPEGRYANADGVYSRSFSYSYEPAVQAAYDENVKSLNELQEKPYNKYIDSFYIAGEQGGRYDYGTTSVNAYREYLRKKYGEVAKLNEAWHTEYQKFEDIVPAKRSECVGEKALADLVERAKATANFIDFRDFCSKAYADFLARGRVKALNDADPMKRPVGAQFANLDLSAVRWADWRPLDFEDIMRIALKDATQFCYDVYAVDDWVGAEYDLFSALGQEKLKLVIREGGTHTPNAEIAARSYWTLVGKGLRGFSLFTYQEGNGHPEFPKFALVNVDQTPRPKLAAYSDIMRAINQFEQIIMDANRQFPTKPVAIYYSKTNNTLQPNPYGSIFDTAPDSPFHVYEMIRGNGYPVTFITDRQILEGERLKDVSAIFFIDAKYIPDEVLDKVKAWVNDGGAVLADGQPGIYNGHGFPSDSFIKYLNIEPVNRKKDVDRMALDKHNFGYSSMAFDLINSERSYESTFEFFQQYDSKHPIVQKTGKFMFSGFGFNRVKANGGEVVIMGQNGEPAGVISNYGKGTTFYFAGFLGSIYGGAATQFEWRDSHSEDSAYRFMDAYLSSVGVQKLADVTGLRNKVRNKLRIEAPLVDSKNNMMISMTSYNDDDVRPFHLSYVMPKGVPVPKQLFAITNSNRTVTPLKFTVKDGKLDCDIPTFMTHAALFAVQETNPIVSLKVEGAERGTAGLAVVNPDQQITVKAKIYNPSDRKISSGKLTLRLPEGWFYDKENVSFASISARGESEEVSFTVQAPAYCAGQRVRPLNFIFEGKDGEKSMPTAEVVWWQKEQ